MKLFLKRYWIICISIVIAVLLYCYYGTGVTVPSVTLHSVSLNSFAKRADLAKADEWCFVFMGDSRGNDKTFNEALQRAASFNPLFILHGGDFVEHGTADELAHFLKTVHEVPDLPPLFIVRGNHEGHEKLYEQYIGPRDFTIDSERLGFRLVVVDNSSDTLQGKELKYISKKLDQSRPVQFVSMHVPPKTEHWSHHSFTKGKDELINLMADRKVKLGLFSHIHMYDTEEINGIPCIVSGGAGAHLTNYDSSSGKAKYHIVLVEVKQGKVSYKVVWL
jgi:3',5'-cyclic-AMP phosphodiesterase